MAATPARSPRANRESHPWPIARRARPAAAQADLVIADRGYGHDKHRRLFGRRGMTPLIARRGTAHGSGLGRERWVVERGFVHVHNFGRLRIR